MNQEESYIIISRKILNWEWYSDVNTKTLFLHMILKANWKCGRFCGQEIPRGSFASSYQNLSKETGLSIQNIRTAINHLKSTGELTVNQHAKYSVFTINNYSKYQQPNTQSNSQLTRNQQATNRQLTTIEEGNKGINIISAKADIGSKAEKSDIYITIRELYNSVCGSYPRLVKMSESRKKAINARINTGYTVDDFKTLFEKAEASDFLKGKNNRNWRATFDWLICDRNMAKVLEGNYDSLKQEVNQNESIDTCSIRLW